MADPRVDAVLDALVEEAYRIAISRGVAITRPDGWKRWKRSVYADTARREGPGYLRAHYQRLGLGSHQVEAVTCDACSERIVGNAITKPDGTGRYCSLECSGQRAVTLDEYLASLDPERRAEFERILNRRREGAA